MVQTESTHAAAAASQAIRASGAIVEMQPEDFKKILAKSDRPLIVVAESKFFKTTYRYITGYKGLVFFTKASEALTLPALAEIVRAKRIWVPGTM